MLASTPRKSVGFAWSTATELNSRQTSAELSSRSENLDESRSKWERWWRKIKKSNLWGGCCSVSPRCQVTWEWDALCQAVCFSSFNLYTEPFYKWGNWGLRREMTWSHEPENLELGPGLSLLPHSHCWINTLKLHSQESRIGKVNSWYRLFLIHFIPQSIPDGL